MDALGGSSRLICARICVMLTSPAGQALQCLDLLRLWLELGQHQRGGGGLRYDKLSLPTWISANASSFGLIAHMGDV